MPLVFHHIGLACRDLTKEIERLAYLGYELEGEYFIDATQGVEGGFLVGGGPRIEVLRPLGSDGVLEPWLKSGAKLYHLAYRVGEELPEKIDYFRSAGAKVVVPPVQAVAFNGCCICFLMMPNMLLIELISGT